MPRFALLEHDHPVLHWDLLLESGEQLLTWRLLRFPQGNTPIPLEVSCPHRMIYLDYEGPISGNRGTVKRVDSGRFEWIDFGAMQFHLEGHDLCGDFQIRLVDASNGFLESLVRSTSEPA